MNIYLKGFLCNLCFHFSWVNTRNGVAEPFYKKLLNCFRSDFIILHSYQQRVRFNCSTSSSQLGIVSLVLTILAVTWWYPTVALAYISQIAINADYLFSFLFAVYVFVLVISVFTFLPFWKQIVFFLYEFFLKFGYKPFMRYAYLMFSPSSFIKLNESTLYFIIHTCFCPF